ncbi:MAG: hypothetical protein KDI37_06940 [Xanthomonadales bacterium]|nr:hypothetical protein [Xanthomonadales bacterium]
MDEHGWPARGSSEERAIFQALQARLPGLFRDVFGDPAAERTVVVVPGLSLDTETLSRVSGVRHYEERQLSMLMLLRLPRTRVVFVTSQPLAPAIVDYYLNLLPGIPGGHARNRLHLLSAYDGSSRSLTEKLIERPRLLQRIRTAVGDPATAHLSCFNATDAEVTLAVRLGVPLYACDPALGRWGSKSGSRHAFRQAGVQFPDGAEDLRSRAEVVEALLALQQRQPTLRRAVVKLEEGFSGEGNALVDLKNLETNVAALDANLNRRTVPVAEGLSAPDFYRKFNQMGGIVEAFVSGAVKRSPSVQLRINPLAQLELISTHDQVLGGTDEQIFLGSEFPANADYRRDIKDAGRRIGEVLRDAGVLGRMAIDFLSVASETGWQHYAIEINLRKGGTTLPYQMLQFLTAGHYDEAAGEFLTPLGQPRSYVASDNLVRESFRRLVPEDLIDILVEHGLHFDNTRQTGVVFNLIGALAEFGKLGLVAIGCDRAEAQRLFDDTVAVLEREAERD